MLAKAADWTPQILTSVPAPQRLIDEVGQPVFGHFDGPVAELGVEHFNYRNEMDKPASRWAKHFDYKQFQFLSIVTPHYVIGVALADIRYVGSAFCYLYDISSNQLIETSWLKPLGLGYQMSDSPMQGNANIKGTKGSVTFEIEQGLWRLRLNTLGIEADLTLQPDVLSLPMAMCNPTGYSGWTYTQKHNGLALKGSLLVNHEPQPLQRACAGYDFSAGFMRRDTSWRWASINCISEHAVLGLNLAAGVNETGCNENAFWHNGERHLLGPVHFQFTRPRTQSQSAGKWRIFSDNGQVELSFTPKNCRQEKLNLGFLKSNFRQYIGYFDGFIIDNFGNKHQLNQVLGLTEDHFARW
ncbi:DUF2804 domain-containing protein [Shewanella fidelis]|uniref:DUF2804 domain-containing protein n=1 Tax=Shewanella fidelis TaxID=173509 RepID=A0AAW8NLY0_9GAMM|nr:DUF2804 domain-containing protein [Shewanella fidelis]MDR8522849.1 DUF2804 domain-containing protein [Shewanella fidelis]MDW4811825.1 DUF2804 domain-containing protein [Shewanella fidelis]MDW4818105.1 DUF2804 domain-containing protein [Shewanella fidelis]MDW4822172.1 DUF2804 domain-containing protein [Shewanella fidelis]MDW4826389.1 DUF2804 domain-containing protein [Shewanella fidelis]